MSTVPAFGQPTFPAPTPAIWTGLPHDARLTALRLLAGQSIGEMARALETTRSSIAGFCYRNNIRVGGIDNAQPATARITGDGRTAKPAFPVLPPVAPATWVPHRPVVALIDLEDGQCKWPVDGGFCGTPAGRRSYCATHHAKAFVPATIGEYDYNSRLGGKSKAGIYGVTLKEALPLVRAQESKKGGAE